MENFLFSANQEQFKEANGYFWQFQQEHSSRSNPMALKGAGIGIS